MRKTTYKYPNKQVITKLDAQKAEPENKQRRIE